VIELLVVIAIIAVLIALLCQRCKPLGRPPGVSSAQTSRSAFGPNQSRRLASFTDGLSQSLLAAESRSHHAGGVNSLFGDGSVRFIKNSINWQTWRGLGTIAGGEVLSADSY
jgi:prepilin-type processing-associated H-X9-DG protein